MSEVTENKPQSKIGDHFIHVGLLTEQQVNAIIDRQNEYHVRFGEAAIQLGYLTQQQVQYGLSQQFNYATALTENSSLSKKLVVAHEPFGLESENIRHIRAEISVRLRNKYPFAFAIASAKNGEGKTYLACNLALAFSQMGKRTLLIDGNMRTPSVHQLFGLDNKVGLSTILSERTPPNITQKIKEFPDLSVLPAGPTPPNPQEIMMNNGIRKLIDYFAHDFDIFIFDTPAVTQYADTQTLVEQIGMSVLVGKKDVTAFNDLRDLHEEILTTGTQIIGSVYNDFSPEPAPIDRYEQYWHRFTKWFLKKR